MAIIFYNIYNILRGLLGKLNTTAHIHFRMQVVIACYNKKSLSYYEIVMIL